MFKQIRKKFIAIAMASTAAVLIIIIGAINIANYINVNETLDARLDLIAGNGGTFPDLSQESPDGNSPTDMAPASGDTEFVPDTEMVPPDNGPANGIPNDFDMNHISKESQFDTRYFTVEINQNGEVTTINTGKIASVTTTEASDYALEIYDKGSSKGFIDDYKYLVVSQDDSSLYIFLNCERELRTLRYFIFASVGTSLVGLIIVFLLICIFSGKILKPVSESYEKQKRFITDASHEIKTPLTVIDANTEIIEMTSGENEWTASIKKQVKRLAGLTEHLVFLARMDEEATKLEMADFNLSDALIDTAEPFKNVALSKNKTLELDITDNVTLKGDEKNIRQMTSLLLDNAIKYSSENGFIKLSLKVKGRNRILTFYNTAEGIETGNLDKYFDRFYRPDSSRNSKTGGSGIGLSVVQSIVKAHNGKINAKSTDGSSFIITIIL